MNNVKITSVQYGEQIVVLSASEPAPPRVLIPLSISSGVKHMANTQTLLTGIAVAEPLVTEPTFTVDSNIGLPFIKGVSVALVLNKIAHGLSPEEISSQLPGLTVDDVRACQSLAAVVLGQPKFPWDADELNELMWLKGESALWDSITSDPWADSGDE